MYIHTFLKDARTWNEWYIYGIQNTCVIWVFSITRWDLSTKYKWSKNRLRKSEHRQLSSCPLEKNTDQFLSIFILSLLNHLNSFYDLRAYLSQRIRNRITSNLPTSIDVCCIFSSHLCFIFGSILVDETGSVGWLRPYFLFVHLIGKKIKLFENDICEFLRKKT